MSDTETTARHELRLKQARQVRHPLYYSPGLSIEQQYYMNRNWAWRRRQQNRRAYLPRLVACGFRIVFSLFSILRHREFSIRRVYNVFRALHNGFYGKLRPY